MKIIAPESTVVDYELLDLEGIFTKVTTDEGYERASADLSVKFDRWTSVSEFKVKGRSKDIKGSYLANTEHVLSAPPGLAVSYPELIDLLQAGMEATERSYDLLTEAKRQIARLVTSKDELGGMLFKPTTVSEQVSDLWLDYQAQSRNVFASRENSGRKTLGMLVDKHAQWDEIQNDLLDMDRKIIKPKSFNRLLDETSDVVKLLRESMENEKITKERRGQIRELLYNVAFAYESYASYYYTFIVTCNCVKGNMVELTK